VSETKRRLTEQLDEYYRSCGWAVRRHDDGTVRAAGPGGVTWIGLAVTSDDLAADGFDDRLLGLSDERMPQGALCPFELLPAEDCAAELRARLERLRLADRGHVAVYSFAA
jgi:hypothetical protein